MVRWTYLSQVERGMIQWVCVDTQICPEYMAFPQLSLNLSTSVCRGR